MTNTVPSLALAEGLSVGSRYGDFEVLSIEECGGYGPIAAVPESDSWAFSSALVDPQALAAWRCGSKTALQAGLTATSITFHMIGMCSLPVNPAVTVVMEAAGISINIVELGIAYIPCEEDPREKARDFCRLMRAQGYSCDPTKAVFED